MPGVSGGSPSSRRLPRRLAAAAAELFWAGSAMLGLWALCILAELSLSLDGTGSVLLIAAFGASVTLLIGQPHSPMAACWPALVGSMSSALIGIVIRHAELESPALAAVVAVVLAIVVMRALEAMHPPGGAIALLAVLGGAPIIRLGWLYILLPVGMGTAWLLVVRQLRIIYGRSPSEPATDSFT